MNKIAQMSAAKRAEVFAETANQMNLPDVIIEKDFWVCWLLKQLFSIESLSDTLLFKGGTSLSKIFRAINRFSEDIDLAVDYSKLGFTGSRDPLQPGISRSKQTKILSEMMLECQRYIKGTFVSAVKERCGRVLLSGERWNLEVDPTDPNIVRFQYPTAMQSHLPYVIPQVLLELGTHASFIPRDRFIIKSFVAEQFPALADEQDVSVVALLAKRTFWEKVTILHAEHHRPIEKHIPSRYSRHYYDVAMMSQGPVKEEALTDPELLAKVVKHKTIFYPSAWSRYDLATLGSIHVVPLEGRISALKQDYRDMSVMIFGEAPSFDSIIENLTTLEKEINSI